MMHAWHWPQWVMASWYAFMLLKSAYLVGEKKREVGGVLYVILTMMLVTGFVSILHAGGFW